MAFKTSMELEDLYDRLRDLEARKDSFFDGDDSPNYGDRGYQDICEQISDIAEQISDYERDCDENPDVIDTEIFEIEDISTDNPYYDNAGDYEIDFGD